MCEIQWIDDKGNPTPDDNAPVGRVRCKLYSYERMATMTRKPWAGDWSAWFSICEEHAKQLTRPDMGDWTFEAVKNYEITFVWPNGDWTWIYASAPDFHDVLAIAVDKCPDGARVHGVQFMTPKQVDANLAAAAKRQKQFAAN